MSSRRKRLVINNIEEMPQMYNERTISTRAAAKGYKDFDYLHKLPKAEQEWMAKFIQEYYYDSISNVSPLHKGKKARRELDTDNNKRRVDISNLPKVIVQIPRQPLKVSSPEDAIIEIIDQCRKNPE